MAFDSIKIVGALTEKEAEYECESRIRIKNEKSKKGKKLKRVRRLLSCGAIDCQRKVR